MERRRIVEALETQNIQTRMLFAGNLLRQPCFDELRASKTGYRIVGTLENTDRIMERSFWIGVYPGMTERRIERMSVALHKALGI